MRVSINYLELSSDDIAASKAFSSLSGWGFTDYGPGYAGFEDAGLDGGIEQAGRAARRRSRCFTPPILM